MRKQKASETRFLSIFDGFESHLGPPKRSQDAQKSMLKRHLGTRLFRPKRRQEPPAPFFAVEDGVGPDLLGEDLGGGKPDVQTPRTFKSGTLRRRPESRIMQFSTPSLDGRRIEAPMGGEYRRPTFLQQGGLGLEKECRSTEL